MKKTLTGFLAVLMALLMLPGITAFADEDTQSPIIWMNTFQIIVKDGKQLAESGDYVDLVVAATDNVGIDEFLIRVDSPSGSDYRIYKMSNISGTDYYGVEIKITDETDAGYYNISAMKASDASEHYMLITNLNEYRFGVKGEIEEGDVSLANGTEYVYTPSPVRPKIDVTHRGIKLTDGVDYTVAYKNNTAVGTATATVTGIGCFSGKIAKEFTIKPQTKFSVKLSTNTYVYNGKIKKPAVTVYDGKSVVDKSNYTVTYANGRKNVGKYAVKITMKNNYIGSKTAHIVIKPRGTSVTKAAPVKKGVKITWKRQNVQTTGYQIQYSTAKNFKAGTKHVISIYGKNPVKTVKGLKSGKKYYFRIRTFKTKNGSTFYSKWSKAKAAKAK